MDERDRGLGATSQGEPLSVQTFVVRTLRSAALRAEGELEILTDSAIVRGWPDDSNYMADLWHRVREEIAEERHTNDSRLPEAVGGDFIELKHVTVTPFATPEQEHRFDDLVLFTHQIRALRTTRRPEGMTEERNRRSPEADARPSS